MSSAAILVGPVWLLVVVVSGLLLATLLVALINGDDE